MRLRSRAVLTGLMAAAAVAVPVASHAVTPADTAAPVTAQNGYQNIAGPYANLHACYAGREIFLMNGHPAWKMTDCFVYSDGRAAFFWNP